MDEKCIMVETKLGTIRVEVKTDGEYPGVYVDLVGETVNGLFFGDGEKGEVSLAMVEYEPYKNKIQTVVYGDGNNDEPTHIIEHLNTNKDSAIEND